MHYFLWNCTSQPASNTTSKRFLQDRIVVVVKRACWHYLDGFLLFRARDFAMRKKRGQGTVKEENR